MENCGAMMTQTFLAPVKENVGLLKLTERFYGNQMEASNDKKLLKFFCVTP